LGYVLRAAFRLAEWESLFALQADVGEVMHEGAIAGHRQGSSNGEGLVLRHGSRRLHHT